MTIINYKLFIDHFDKIFPPVKDEGCNFSNGGWSVQRSVAWHKAYKDQIEQLVRDVEPQSNEWNAHSYAWFRMLDDGGSPVYGRACRALNICTKCYREYGQQYYANNCKCEKSTIPTKNPNGKNIKKNTRLKLR